MLFTVPGTFWVGARKLKLHAFVFAVIVYVYIIYVFTVYIYMYLVTSSYLYTCCLYHVTGTMYRHALHSPISPANSQGPQRSQKQIYKVNKSHKGLDFSENFFVFLRLEFGRFQVFFVHYEKGENRAEYNQTKRLLTSMLLSVLT